MIGNKVAVKGDVRKIVGKDLTYGGKADLGIWTAGEIKYSFHELLTIGGVDNKVIYKAECTFKFKGIKTIGTTVKDIKGSEIVKLEAKTTKLKINGKNLLVDGDSKTDIYGNKLQVKASKNLSTF